MQAVSLTGSKATKAPSGKSSLGQRFTGANLQVQGIRQETFEGPRGAPPNAIPPGNVAWVGPETDGDDLTLEWMLNVKNTGDERGQAVAKVVVEDLLETDWAEASNGQVAPGETVRSWARADASAGWLPQGQDERTLSVTIIVGHQLIAEGSLTDVVGIQTDDRIQTEAKIKYRGVPEVTIAEWITVPALRQNQDWKAEVAFKNVGSELADVGPTLSIGGETEGNPRVNLDPGESATPRFRLNENEVQSILERHSGSVTAEMRTPSHVSTIEVPIAEGHGNAGGGSSGSGDTDRRDRGRNGGTSGGDTSGGDTSGGDTSGEDTSSGDSSSGGRSGGDTDRRDRDSGGDSDGGSGGGGGGVQGSHRPPRSAGLGDVDGDGKVSPQDVEMANKIAAGLIDPTSEQVRRADVDGDGGVDTNDPGLIAQYLGGKIDSFPAEGGPDEGGGEGPSGGNPSDDPDERGSDVVRSRPPRAGGLGDVTGTGEVTQEDAERARLHAQGKQTLSPGKLPQADVDGDGDVTTSDASLIQQYVRGQVSSFPAEDVSRSRSPRPEDLGDVTGTGDVTLADVEAAKRVARGTRSASEEEVRRADVNADGSVTVADAALIEEYVRGRVDQFPAETKDTGSEGEGDASEPQSAGGGLALAAGAALVGGYFLSQ